MGKFPCTVYIATEPDMVRDSLYMESTKALALATGADMWAAKPHGTPYGGTCDSGCELGRAARCILVSRGPGWAAWGHAKGPRPFRHPSPAWRPMFFGGVSQVV